MNAALAEVRSIELRLMELEEEKAMLSRRKMEILELNTGTRKPRKDMITPQNRKALFAGLKRSTHELGKA
jgi:hypothetical protein